MAGFKPGQHLAMRPPLTPDEELAIDCWTFCGGWKPELIPFAALYYGVEDLERLTAQLLAIRGAIERQREEEAYAARRHAQHGRP